MGSDHRTIPNNWDHDDLQNQFLFYGVLHTLLDHAIHLRYDDVVVVKWWDRKNLLVRFNMN